MRVTNVTVWGTLRGSARKAEAAAEEIAVATGMAALDVVERNASNAINLDTLPASARRIRIFAIVAMALDTLQKTVNRLVYVVVNFISRYL